MAKAFSAVRQRKIRLSIVFVLLLAGAAFIALGVWRGEVETVFRKAVNICMECIGIG